MMFSQQVDTAHGKNSICLAIDHLVTIFRGKDCFPAPSLLAEKGTLYIPKVLALF